MNTLNILSSRPITNCQICNSRNLKSIINLGSVPPVNQMLDVGSLPDAEVRFPLELLRCSDCTLVQIGYEVDPAILFPHSYPYLSGTTRILRDNFRQLAIESIQMLNLSCSDLVVDIGANDGTLLQPFRDFGLKILGIEPSQAAIVATQKGIPMIKDYFCSETAKKVLNRYGTAKIVTAANVFAHIRNVHEVVDSILEMMDPTGVFISESHYLLDLVETLQYDTVYHEHLRYYSVTSLINLFNFHGMEIIHVVRIPTHGGSIRVYAAKKGMYPIQKSVSEILDLEKGLIDGTLLESFGPRVVESKLNLIKLLSDIKSQGKTIYGIGAPSRSSTLINYVGLNEGIIDAVMEVSSSHKLNKYIPGTRIPVLDEARLYKDNVDFAILFSWHIADELSQIIRSKGFNGEFISPLPDPRILSLIDCNLS